MQVRLLSHTEKPDEFAARCALATRTKEDFWDISAPKQGFGRLLLEKCLYQVPPHSSVLEHVSFTFEIKGVSRVLTHQLVRHRIASYSQISHRHMKVDNVVIPREVRNALEIKTVEDNTKWVESLLRPYNDAVRKGASMEMARYVAPAGVPTGIIVTMNARELWEVFFPLRLSEAAQREIRILAYLMLELVKEVAPAIFDNFKVDKNLLEKNR